MNGQPAWGVTWIDVGYYSSKVDKRNSFQLVLIDVSSVTGVPGDFNLEFNYDKIQWEAGEASGGVNGLGGNSARAGFSNGTTQPGTFLEMDGSARNGGLLDSNTSTGLIRRSLPPGSTPLGRYTFFVRNGRPQLVDLSVTGIDTPDPWNSGTLQYQFTVQNLGDGDPATSPDPAATGVRFVNQLPANLGFVSMSGPGCSYVAGTRTITCLIGTLNPGDSANVTVVTQPTAAGGAFLVNTAVVSDNEADPDPSNNTFIARTNAADPDASITACNPSAAPPFSVTEGATCTFTISLSRQTPLQVTVSYASANGTGLAGSDFTAISGSVTFPANTTTLTKTVNVTTTNDTLDEDAEDFSVSLTSAVNANLSLTQSTAVASIIDNDAAPSVKLSDCSAVEGNAGLAPCVLTVGLFTGTTPATSGKTVSVDYLVSDGTATLADSDYAADSMSGTLYFTPGKQSQELRIYGVGDTNVEAHETANVALNNLVNLCTSSCAHDLNAVATIVNDDGPVLSIGDVTVSEPVNTGGTTNAAFTVTMSPASAQTVVVTYFTAPLTATANVDYTTVTTATLTFTPGQTSKTFNIVVRHDLVREPTEAFKVVLNPATYASIPNPAAYGSILDNDGGGGGRPVELAHGFDHVYDLAAPDPATPKVDWFMMAQAPYASYEVVVDGTSGDLTDPTAPLRVRRLAADQIAAPPPAAVPVGRGEARALRWMNGPAADNTQWITVESGASGVACDVDCGPDDTFHIRFYETTCTIPRFNNSGSQFTVLLLQNPTSDPITGTAYFWKATGTLLASYPFTLARQGVLTLNTSAVAGLSGQSGAITIAYDGPFGSLVGKSVAVEPATGFSFDSPMSLRAVR